MVQAAEATAEQTHVMSGEQAVVVLRKQTADEVKDTRGEADQVNYVILRRNNRNQPLSANVAVVVSGPRQGMS